jgi:hypothetical protein
MREIFFYIVLFSFDVAGVIKTTGRKLDRENQAEHILEVSTTYTFAVFGSYFIALSNQCTPFSLCL